MSVLSELVKRTIETDGLKGFLFTMPVCTRKWVNAASATVTGTISFNRATLSLDNTSANWLAPFSATCRFVDNSANKINVSLYKANGTPLNENGILFTLYPQQHLRLKRLAAAKCEISGAHNLRRAEGLAIRQVPNYFFISNAAVTNSFMNGKVDSGDDIGFNGSLSFYDEDGNIIHPLFLASLMKVLTTQYTALLLDSALPDQLSNIVALDTATTKSIRLIRPDGSVYTDTNVTGVTATAEAASNGVYTLNAFTGTDTTILGEVTRRADTGATGAFPLLTASRLLMALSTYGRLSDKVQLAKVPTGITIQHDFFTIRIVELEKFLIGEKNSAFNGSKLEPAIPVRLHEDVTFLPTGNDAAAAIQQVFAGTPTESLCVGTQLKPAFPLPANLTDTQWPAFPATGAVVPENDTFPTQYKSVLETNATANFITPSSPGQATDVQLVLKGLPLGAAVRVYNRVFAADAVITRGDGAGGVVTNTSTPVTGTTFTGQLTLDLKDPLGLKRPDGTITVPSNPRLIIDVMVNQRGARLRKRLFGNIQMAVNTTQVPPLAAPPDNISATASKKGISNSSILGFDSAVLTIDLTTPDNALNTILQLTGEANPRDASRYPTMARRDLLCAALASGAWKGLISGGTITKDIHCSQLPIGAPGSLGGKETCYNGVFANNNRLAFDIARMAFRRTTSFYARLAPLAGATWNEPAAKTPLAESDTPSGGRGFIHGAVLQNIAPNCETPELAILKALVEPNINSIPADWNALVDTVVGWINGISTSSLPTALQTAANRLKTELVGLLNGLKSTNPADETRNERLYNELKRELSSALYGRRDTQWALKQAIKQARHFIYIETPGLSFTQRGAAQDYSVNLFEELQTRLTSNPALRVMICVPKFPDYSRKYDQWIRREVKARFTLINALPASQIVCFHPIGFPGRPANIETQTVIVDDNWMLTGSSAFRRRGLTFDGSSDIVCTDGDTVMGRSLKIKNFRKNLIAQRLQFDIGNRSTDAKPVMLESGLSTFNLIRALLVAGGLGKIERLWNGRVEGVAFVEPTIDEDLANPEGISFNALSAIIMAAFASLPK